MAGQAYEAQALLRICLEHGGYAHYIGGDQERYKLWMSRQDSQASKKAVRDFFSHGKISRQLKAADEKLGGTYSQLYDRTIDQGAHPNEMGVSLSSNLVEQRDGGAQFQTIYLHDDEFLLDLSLKSVAQVGLCVLRIGQVIYPTRVQALGINHQLAQMFKRF